MIRFFSGRERSISGIETDGFIDGGRMLSERAFKNVC